VRHRAKLRNGLLAAGLTLAFGPGWPAPAAAQPGPDMVAVEAMQCWRRIASHAVHVGERFDMVLTNPPFGRSSSDSYEREDFWATTRNKQLNFVQHVVGMLKVGGTAAVVVPDNVLFEAGAGETIRRRLLHDCEVHTLLRLPTGIFYAQGVKANVLFFRRREGAEQAWTRELWVYDLRTNKHFTLKQNPLTRADLDDFVACYNPAARHQRQESERFKRYTYDDLMARDKVSLDLFWLRDDSLEDIDNLPPPAVLAAQIAEDLQSALTEIQALTESLTATAEREAAG